MMDADGKQRREEGEMVGLICSANESDSARLTRPEHRSYRTFYWRAAAAEAEGLDDRAKIAGLSQGDSGCLRVSQGGLGVFQGVENEGGRWKAKQVRWLAPYSRILSRWKCQIKLHELF